MPFLVICCAAMQVMYRIFCILQNLRDQIGQNGFDLVTSGTTSPSTCGPPCFRTIFPSSFVIFLTTCLTCHEVVSKAFNVARVVDFHNSLTSIAFFGNLTFLALLRKDILCCAKGLLLGELPCQLLSAGVAAQISPCAGDRCVFPLISYLALLASPRSYCIRGRNRLVSRAQRRS